VSKCKSKKKLDDNFNEALELVKPAFQERKAVLSQWKTERRSKLDLVISCSLLFFIFCSNEHFFSYDRDHRLTALPIATERSEKSKFVPRTLTTLLNASVTGRK